jgi:galactose mutarotase-like enzyme
VGDIRQLARVEEAGASDGSGRLWRLDVSPLSLTLLPDRGFDVGALWYRGLPMAWISPTGFRPQGGARPDWFAAFGGGFLTTCGLDNVGAPCREEGVDYPQHGRYASLPAERAAWSGAWREGGYEVRVEGTVRQARVFGENLVLSRRYTLRLGEPTLILDDEVANEGYTPAPLLLLYHVNLGFPLLDDQTALRFPPGPVEARDADARMGLAEAARSGPPVPGMREQVFRRRPAGERAEVSVDNPRLGVGLTLAYSPRQLPQLWQWRMLGEGTYVMGIEPANATVLGRAVQRAEGGLDMLAPGETRSFHLEFRFRDLDGSQAAP